MKRRILFWGLVMALVLSLVSCKKEIDFYTLSEDEQIDYLIDAFERVFEKGDALFAECKTANEFGKHLGAITSIKGVNDAYVDGSSVFIDMVNGSTISYMYTPAPLALEEIPASLAKDVSMAPTRSESYPDPGVVNHFSEYKKACLINQQSNDESRDYIPQYLFPNAREALENIGIEVEEVLSPTRVFFQKDIYQYDIVYLITHGGYNSRTGRHWLLTSEPLGWRDKTRDFFRMQFLGSHPEDIGIVDEVHDGDSVEVKYLMISNEDIASAEHQFTNPGRAIVFNSACQSLLGNDNLWEAFKQRGAGFYIGYDETNSYGKLGGMYYFGRLSSGMSLLNALNDLPEYIRIDHETEEDEAGNVREYDALMLYRMDDGSDMESVCIARPSVIGHEYCSNKDQLDVELKGSASLYAPPYLVYRDRQTNETEFYDYEFSYSLFRYGFCISETPEISEGRMLDPVKKGDDLFQYQPYQVNFSVIAEDLKSEKQYYVWSYVFDGKDYIFGERYSFVTKRINQVIPVDILEELEKHIPVHDGVNPPNVEGQYVFSPMTLTYSTHGYKPGDVFADTYVQFYNQDDTNNSLDYKEAQKSLGEAVGTGAFISGEGNEFSVFFNTEGVTYFSDYNVYTKEALVLTGTKTEKGIADFYYGFVMLEKSDDPKEHIVPVGTIRVFRDGDGLGAPVNYFGNQTSRLSKDFMYNPGKLPGLLEAR